MKPIALVCSDFHLSDQPPRCRANEPDWFCYMLYVFDQIQDIALQYKIDSILFCGDLFGKPKVSPKLEALTIKKMLDNDSMHWYSVMGQHDMPGHTISRINESSFGVLLASHAISLTGLCPFNVESAHFGQKLYNSVDRESDIGMIHKFLWKGDSPFPEAPIEGNVRNFMKEMLSSDFEIIFSGDNHISFEAKMTKGDGSVLQVVNCGSLMRRSVDQIGHVPSVIILSTDGKSYSTKRVYLDISQDVFTVDRIKPESKKNSTNDLQSFIMVLKQHVGRKELSFDTALETVYASMDVEQDTRQVIETVREENQ